MNDNIQELSYQLLAYSGGASSNGFEAIDEAKAVHFERVNALLKEADAYLLKAGLIQAQLREKLGNDFISNHDALLAQAESYYHLASNNLQFSRTLCDLILKQLKS